MKKLMLIVVLILNLSFMSPGNENAADSKTHFANAATQNLHKHVTFLTAIDPPRTFTHPHSLNRAADYIHDQLKQYGCRTQYQSYHALGRTYKNVVGIMGPEKGEIIVVGAHYDVCGKQPGADDNASGVATLLEIAGLINQRKPTLKHPIHFVAFSLEEPPFFRTRFMGSAVHAGQLKKKRTKVKLMINLDMLGFYQITKKKGYLYEYLEKEPKDRANTLAVVGKLEEKTAAIKAKTLMQPNCPLEILTLTAPENTNALDWSDHMNYWKRNYPAIFITTAYINDNPNYHTNNDTIQTLNFEKLTAATEAIYNAVVNY